ncbi:MAG TPA: tRNA (guanosine(37)-N1)-methyltransferase TrmD [Patescibacteria group bacterium]|nr:tRNA (guanosine(37)-N1)-methyltransferase TrmD [Patescibacteria group bacterium]
MKFQIITIFPKILNSYLEESILKRAKIKKIIDIKAHDLRKWTIDRHKTVDDTPYGGGAGMLMKVDPIYQAITSLKKEGKNIKNKERKIILLSASGTKWTQKTALKYSKLKEIIFICGRYEGVDERVKEFIDDEVSIGDYVLTGGELAAMVIIDSITRLLPGSLGNKESIEEESHSQVGLGEYPQYTRPEIFKVGRKKYQVPEILLSGNHKKIKDWRKIKQKKLN